MAETAIAAHAARRGTSLVCSHPDQQAARRRGQIKGEPAIPNPEGALISRYVWCYPAAR
jgi:hypothetical protein